MPHVLTANRLKSGDVVYWNATRHWVLSLGEADVLDDVAAQTALEGAAEWIRSQDVVAPYLFDVRVHEGQISPVKAREAIRAAGPTVRTDLGKQAV